MSSQSLTTSSGQVVGSQVIEEFEATLRGEVIHPDDEGYDEARKIFNAMIDNGRASCSTRCSPSWSTPSTSTISETKVKTASEQLIRRPSTNAWSP